MNILVTGAAGFIGSHLTRALLEAGHDVMGLDNFDPFYNPRQKEINLKTIRPNKQFQFVQLDIRSNKKLTDTCRSFSPIIIYHLAGRGGMMHSTKKPFLYLDEIIRGTVSVLEAAKKTGVRAVINASSSSVYGLSTKFPYTELLPTDEPTAPYAAAKKSSELFGYCYHHLYGMTVVNARFFSVYGPCGRPDQIIYKLTHAIDQQIPIPWYTPEPIRDFTYVADIVAALSSMTALPAHSYFVLNIGCGKPIALSAVIQLLEQALGKKAIIAPTAKPAPASDFPKTFADNALAKKILRWKPTVSINQGIPLFVAWYKQYASV